MIAFVSYNTIWLGDDINYAYSFTFERNRYEIESLSDIIASQNEHYQMVNGRYLAHCLVQLFCGILGHGPFAIANGFIYICLVLILCKIAGADWRNWKVLLGISSLALLAFQTKMVPSCQIGYIWMFVLSLGWIYFFLKKNIKTRNWLKLCLALILSILIGNGQEGLNIGICGAIVIYWINNKFKFSPMQYVMAIGFGIGALFCCLSPGTLGRVETTGASSFVVKIVSIMNLFYYGRAIWVMMAVVVMAKFRSDISWSQIYKSSSFYWNVLIVLILFNWAIGFPSNRAMFGIELMALIITFKCLPRQQLSKFWLTCLTILCALIYSIQIEQVLRHKNFTNSVVEAYLDSADGTVYADFDNSSLIPYCNRFITGYKAFTTGCIKDYEADMLNKRLKTNYPDKDRLKVLPTILENPPAENLVIELTDGYWLAIQDKLHPKDFIIKRTVGWKTVAPLVVDFSNPVYENDRIRAKIILHDEYKIMNISNMEVEKL